MIVDPQAMKTPLATPAHAAPIPLDDLIDTLSLAMPVEVRGAHALAVANGRVTEAKRIIIRYVLNQLLPEKR